MTLTFLNECFERQLTDLLGPIAATVELYEAQAVVSITKK